MARTLKKGANLYSKDSRPLSLDEISLDAVEDFFLEDPELSDTALKSYIISEHRATKVCQALNIDTIRILSLRSIKRYASKVRNKRYIYELSN